MTIPMPKMSLAYWIDRARKELEAGKVISARGSMRRALTQEADHAKS